MTTDAEWFVNLLRSHEGRMPCGEGRKLLATHLGKSIRTVDRLIHEWEEVGLIKTIGKGKAQEYVPIKQEQPKPVEADLGKNKGNAPSELPIPLRNLPRENVEAIVALKDISDMYPNHVFRENFELAIRHLEEGGRADKAGWLIMKSFFYQVVPKEIRTNHPAFDEKKLLKLLRSKGRMHMFFARLYGLSIAEDALIYEGALKRFTDLPGDSGTVRDPYT